MDQYKELHDATNEYTESSEHRALEMRLLEKFHYCKYGDTMLLNQVSQEYLEEKSEQYYGFHGDEQSFRNKVEDFIFNNGFLEIVLAEVTADLWIQNYSHLFQRIEYVKTSLFDDIASGTDIVFECVDAEGESMFVAADIAVTNSNQRIDHKENLHYSEDDRERRAYVTLQEYEKTVVP
ncbi:MAG: hypothetical protein H6765_01905 [Candidatus Peribacteria bacterium]|nr:MAG: hypothetical protein H6765_01905 [Candidatus Peribacteria bacterium]